MSVLVLLAASAWGAKHSIAGRVVDRNGEPMSRAVVSLAPGNVELVTDRDGRFLVDYLRDEAGERVKMRKKTEYALTVFKPGYHDFAVTVPYRRVRDRGGLPGRSARAGQEREDEHHWPS